MLVDFLSGEPFSRQRGDLKDDVLTRGADCSFATSENRLDPSALIHGFENDDDVMNDRQHLQVHKVRKH